MPTLGPERGRERGKRGGVKLWRKLCLSEGTGRFRSLPEPTTIAETGSRVREVWDSRSCRFMDTPTFSNRATGRRQESQPVQVFCFKLDEFRSFEDI